MKTRVFWSVLISFLGAAAAPCERAHAQLHFGDILLAQNAAGDRIMTGQVDPITGLPVFSVRVFGAEFGEAPNFTNDPGMDSHAGAFPPNSQIGFTIRKALRAWDGAEFSDLPTERIAVKFGPLGPVLTPLTDVPVVGFSMSVNSGGQFHHHPGYTLQSPADDGIYLYEVEVWSTVSSIAASPPFWIVFNQNMPVSDLEAAIDWANENLVGCPSDFDQNHFVNGDDFDAFVVAFEAGEITADFDVNGFVNGDDFDAFVTAFEAGC